MQIPFCTRVPSNWTSFSDFQVEVYPKKCLSSISCCQQAPSSTLPTCHLVSVSTVDDLAGRNVSPRGRPPHSSTIAQESTQRALVSSTIGFALLMKIFISHFIICCFFIPNSFCAKPVFCLVKKSVHKFYLNAGFNNPLLYPMCRHTQALHTYRINLSPFTKDFRVWGAPIET